MNPCLFGYAPAVVTKYQKRISGPLLDRIDVHIEVPGVDYEKLNWDRLCESSESIRRRVKAARDIQQKPFQMEVQISSVVPICVLVRQGNFVSCRIMVRV